MDRIDIDAFGGMIPILGPHKLPHGAAQSASNCDLSGGTLKAWNKSVSVYDAVLATGTIGSIFLYRKSDGTQLWCEWTQDVDVAPGPISGDTTNRTYFTGTDYPRVFDSAMSDVGAGTTYPKSSYILGIPASVAAPSAVLGAGGAGTARNLVYVYTYVRKWSSGKVDESAPSPASTAVLALPGQVVTVGTFAAAPTSRGVTHIRIYRASTGDYQYVTEITVATASYADSALDSALGDVLETLDWLPPPDDMAGLISLPNGCFAGFAGNEVCISVPYQVHAYPSDYRVAFPYDVVGIGHVGGMIVVGTTGFTYLIDGNDPAVLGKLQASIEYPCLAKRGMTSSDDGVMYPTHDGLAHVNQGGGISLSTASLMGREQWDKYFAETVRAIVFRGGYFGFFDNTGAAGVANDGFHIDYVNPTGITGMFGGVHCVHVDKTDGKLYYVATANAVNHIYEWDAQTDWVQYLWQSKKFISGHPHVYAAVRVYGGWANALTQAEQDAYNAARDAIIAANQALLASDYAATLSGASISEYEIVGSQLAAVPAALDDIVGLTFKLYADGVVGESLTVTGDEPRRLVGGYQAKNFELELQGHIDVYRVIVAPSIMDIDDA